MTRSPAATPAQTPAASSTRLLSDSFAHQHQERPRLITNRSFLRRRRQSPSCHLRLLSNTYLPTSVLLFESCACPRQLPDSCGPSTVIACQLGLALPSLHPGSVVSESHLTPVEEHTNVAKRHQAHNLITSVFAAIGHNTNIIP